MKWKNKMFLIIFLLFIPSLVFASNGDNFITILGALAVEAFVSIHMSLFVLKPLADIFSKENSKKTFWILFVIRATILLYCDFFVTPAIAGIDILAIFVGGFIVVPICAAITKTQINRRSNQVIRTTLTTGSTPPTDQVTGIELKCAKCGAVLQITDKVCSSCSEPFDGNNVVVAENANATVQTPPKVAVLPSNFDQIYSLPEEKMVEEFIKIELSKAGIDKSSALIPSDILKRKKILNIIFSILIFVYITLIFFHFPIYTYVIGLVILFIFFKVTRKYDLIKYLKKQLKARPGEKVSNIVMNVKNTFISDNSKVTFIIGMAIAVIMPLIIFSSPKIIYEKVDNGYAVRYYIFGLTNFKTATIPETYKNEKVVSLRGNTFSNMPFLERVNLPDSIIEIRGQAFKNCYKLTEVNIPKNLEYLGGGAFYNAKSIKRVEFPDTLTYLGGESFYGAKSLEYVKLSNNLTEIRGDSFEYCTSLKSITIPDNVTRIGGHAFYGDTSLSEVSISENSKLMEIGSSAFRQCYELDEITLPKDTIYNERAFKESPTIIKRFNSENSEYLRLTDTSETKSAINLYEKVTFTNFNISVILDSYKYNINGISSGNLIIDFNDGIHKYIHFNFSITNPSDMENDIGIFNYDNFLFQVLNPTKEGLTMVISKNPDYSSNYTYLIQRSILGEGDSFTLPNSDKTIKLEKIIDKGYRYDYIFSCNGVNFSKPIGNGYFNSADIDNDIKIQIDSFYGSNIYLRVYYN